MKALVLGAAAGGGLPQWNCACEQCARARSAGQGLAQDCLAVTGAGTSWYLVNASPDIRTQILRTPELTPGPGRRETPLRGVLLTDAELDHTLGVLALREGSPLDVYAPEPVLDALGDGFPVRRILEPYGSVTWHPVRPGAPLELDERLSATAIPLSTKRPRYAAASPERDDWVVAYRFEDRASGGVLVYAPCLAEWTDAFDVAVSDADCVVLDGTFFDDEEMIRATGLAGRTARSMGHLPITDSLERLGGHAISRSLYTHLNNTNPLLDVDSPEYRRLRVAGVEVAQDGAVLEV